MERFVNFSIHNSKFEGERENIIFGLNGLKLLGCNILTTILLGIAFNLTFEILLFLLSFMLIRSYAGGYHCKKSMNCYWMSNSIIVLVLVIIRYVNIENIVPFCILILILALYTLYKYAPLETENKPLDKDEKRYFRKKAIRNMCFEIIIGMGMYFLGFKQYSFIIALAIILSGALVVVQLIYVTIHRAESSK